MRSTKTTRKDKKQSKSAEKKYSIKKNQIELLLYNNKQIEPKFKQADMENFGKTVQLQRVKARSSMGSYIVQQKKHSIDLLMPNKKISLSNWMEQQVQNTQKQKPNKNLYDYVHVIGKGGFGRVYKVIDKKTGICYAMKQMSKAVIITKKSVDSVANERKLLTTLKHKFIVNMLQAFQDRDTLYLIMDLMPGGDLRYHICRKHKFTEEQTRFFAACIFIGLEYLHQNRIIHRDIKPQNLVFDANGYLHLTDLGIAKQFKEENSFDTSGTPGYMAPEVMTRQNHGYQVDFYALGVILYELMMGKRPYPGRSRKQIRQQILARQIVIKKSDIPQGWSIQAADFINKLLQRRPIARLGWASPQQVKIHPWLKQFPWKQLYQKQLTSPFKLHSKYNAEDVRYQPTKQDQQFDRLVKQNKILLRKSSVQDLFQGYTFQSQQKQKQKIQHHTTSSELSKRKKQDKIKQ